MQWLNTQLNAFKRATLLSGFWKNRTTFYRDVATAIEAKEQPREFVAGELAIAVTPATSNPDRAQGLVYLRDVMDSGDLSLHQALAATMPKSDSLALSTLKFAKDMPKALRDLSTSIENQQEMTKIVRSALVSPLILLPVTYVFAYVLAAYTIPEFVKAAPDEVWDDTYNSLVRSGAELVNAYGHWFALAAGLAVAWALVWALPNLTQTWRYNMEKSRGYKRALWILVFPLQPLFSLYRDISGAKMLANLASLMQSGMLLKDAVTTLSEGAQPWMRRHLLMVYEHLQLAEGDNVGAFSHGVLPTFLLSRMSSMVRRQSGSFDKVLVELGTTGMVDARESVKTSASSINAALLVIAACVIAFFYLGQGAIVMSIQDANSPTAVMKRQLTAKPKIAPAQVSPTPNLAAKANDAPKTRP